MSDPIVEVIFLNVEDESRIAGGNIPASQLPETFAKNTVMHIGDEPWQVIKAEPVTAEEFITSGKLILTCAKIEYTSDKGILYSLPTFNESMPDTGDLAPEDNVFTLHEDDWRQMEFISASFTEAINLELRHIMQIYQRHQEDGGFTQVHVRKTIPHPLNTTFSFDTLKEYLPPDAKEAAAVVFAQDENRIQDVFALNVSPLVVYGQYAKAGHINRLGLQFIDNPGNTLPYIIDGIVNFMRDYNLVYVDWVRLQIVPADTIGFQEYFKKFGE